MEIASRHHLRDDRVRELEAAVADALRVDLDGDAYELVELDGSPIDLVLIDDAPHACLIGETDDDREPFLTVQGANAYPPSGHLVTVDAGAVEFVSDGADVMRPGIVEVSDDIEAGDLVVIVEETHGKALAVGRARVDADEMAGNSGKVVDSIHHVGDELYGVSL